MGLMLMWNRTRGSNHILSIIFGTTISPINLWMRVALRVMLVVMKNEPSAKVRAPTSSMFESYVEGIRSK